MDGLFIPGGADVEPFYYNQEQQPNTYVHDDNGKKTLFEFALCREARLNNCPLIGICRGAQVGALYHGAPALNQDVPNQNGAIQDLTIQEGKIKEIMGDSIRAVSMHHQCVEEPGPHLIAPIEIEVVDNDRTIRVIKALEHPNGLVYLFQFHPEMGFSYNDVTPNNTLPFYAMGALAEEHKKLVDC